MKTHVMTHSDVKQYSCEQCQKSFVNPQNLKEHTKTHSRDLQMEKCDQCHKLLNVKSMKRHKKIHSTRILHTCEHCKRSYSEAKSLRSQMKTHTHTEQLFPCPLCPKIYKSNQALKQHFTIHN